MDGRGRALSGTGAGMAEVLALGLPRQTQEQFPVNRPPNAATADVCWWAVPTLHLLDIYVYHTYHKTCAFSLIPRRRRSTSKKHGVWFADVEGVFRDPLGIHRKDPDAEDEERFIAIGMGSAGGILVVVYTLRGEEIRLISARNT